MLLLRKALGGKQVRQLYICTILKLERLPYGLGKASATFVFIRNHSASIKNTRPFLCSLNLFIFSTLMCHISSGCRNLPQCRRKKKKGRQANRCSCPSHWEQPRAIRSVTSLFSHAHFILVSKITDLTAPDTIPFFSPLS